MMCKVLCLQLTEPLTEFLASFRLLIVDKLSHEKNHLDKNGTNKMILLLKTSRRISKMIYIPSTFREQSNYNRCCSLICLRRKVLFISNIIFDERVMNH